MITRSKLYVETDNLWRLEALTDKTDDSEIDDATVIASVCEDAPLALAAAPSDLGGGEVSFQITITAAGSGGNYSGTLPDTMNLKALDWYKVFTDITASGVKLLIQDRLQAVFF